MWAVSAAMSGCVDPPPTHQYLHPHRLAGGRAVADAVADAVAVLVVLFTAHRRVELQPASTPPGDDQARPATGTGGVLPRQARVQRLTTPTPPKRRSAGAYPSGPPAPKSL
jgi:hypothetical protein